MNPASPHAVLEVERAISDLRRGQPVLLRGVESEALRVRSGEHSPELQSITDPANPAVQLMKYAGLLPQAVISAADGKESDWLTVTAESIRAYPRALAESLVRVSEASVPLAGAPDAKVIAFRPRFGHEEHLAVLIGNPKAHPAPYVRIHSSCVTGDVFGSLRCDCGNQLKQAMEFMAAAGGGAIIYLSQEGRGIGIANKLRAYSLQDKGLDTVEANIALGFAPDERDFAIAARILRELGLNPIRLLTNNPGKIEAITTQGIAVAERVPVITAPNEHNEQYLDTKALKMGHQF